MKIAIIAESFLPHMNGVTGSVLQSLKHLAGRGHDLLVIAPDAGPIDADLHGAKTHLIRSVPLPSYPEVRMVFARPAKVARMLREFGADVVHLASPFTLGWAGVRAANALGIPAVAVYQTDITAYADKYGVPGGASFAAAHIAKLHRRATLTLVPSSAAHDDLARLGIDRLRQWGRGVDADRFAPERRDAAWRQRVAPGHRIIGFVGRLAPEKQVEDLRALHDLPGTRLVIVGDGPSRDELERQLPNATFAGFLGGTELARALASFDVFVHTGEAETFGQTVQESLASGVPVVSTGAGGPVDLVRPSIDGWLYEPGNLDDMRARVADLIGDPAKLAAFSRAARASVRGRTWAALSEQLEAYYDEAIRLNALDRTLMVRGALRPAHAPAKPTAQLTPAWRRYVALGDSITEGLGDTSRMPEGEFLGWAARLAMLLSDRRGDGLHFANLAVRSRRVTHLAAQVDRALELAPDLVSVLVGSNDLVLARIDIDELAAQLERQVARLRAAGVDVLLGTPFLPRRRMARVVAGRFAAYNARLRQIALDHDCFLLDVDSVPEIGDLEQWSEDRVHLASSGHRILGYRAAAVLGVRDAEALGALDYAFHDDHDVAPPTRMTRGRGWVRTYALPWAWRRVRGRTAGDGLHAKHDDYVTLTPGLPLPPPRSDRSDNTEIGSSHS